MSKIYLTRNTRVTTSTCRCQYFKIIRQVSKTNLRRKELNLRCLSRYEEQFTLYLKSMWIRPLTLFVVFNLGLHLGFGQVKAPLENEFFLQNLKTEYFSGAQSNSIGALAIVNTHFNEAAFQNLGVQMGSRVGDIVTLRFPVEDYHDLMKMEGIDVLQIAGRILPDLSRVIPDVRADSVYQGYNLDTGYTGKNVIIGVTDWGFDYSHPMFYDTALEHTRILAAWDQFKTSGPRPDSFDYGTEYNGEVELLAAQSDTSGVYGYATHGTHVAGIAGGGGAGTIHRGVAYEANFLFVSFLIDEAAVLDAFAWMKQKADEHQKRLVVNMSWGLYHMGTLDGNSILSRAIDLYSDQGVVFVTSGGNNGGEKFHIKHEFSADTILTRVNFFSYSAHPKTWGQSISIWGEEDVDFGAQALILDSDNQVVEMTPFYSTATHTGMVDTTLIVGVDSVFIRLSVERSHPLNGRPHMRLRIKNEQTGLKIGLRSTAEKGIVHYWNLVELTNDVGNWGMPFSALLSGWVEGNDAYGIGEPACTKSAISVAAHASEYKLSNGNLVFGGLADFSSRGPTLDERLKPDISAPGVGVASSISSYTNNSFTLLENVDFKGRPYPFARFSGTSMSSPATAGVIALILEANSSLTSEGVKNILIKTARTDDNTGIIPSTGSHSWGWGKVNASSAVNLAEQTRPRIPWEPYFPEMMIYPNPAQNWIKLYGYSTNPFEVEICDMAANLVLKGIIGGYNEVDISSLAAGMYVVKVVDAEQKVFKLLVVR